MALATSGASSLLLVDTSAWVRGVPSPPDAVELCLCDVTKLEILYTARSFADYRVHEESFDGFRTLVANAETWAIARTAQRELAQLGHHRVSLPDLLVASCAQQHSADVLNVDKHFDVLERVIAFRSVRHE